MTLPLGTITLSEVNVELDYSPTAKINLGASAVRTLAGVPSGRIAMSNLQGKSNSFSFTISSNQTNANLAALATTAGWNGTSQVIATISSGVYISSNSTGTPALTISSSFPNGVSLINNGYIVGMGGAGGTGGGPYGGSAGGAGGLALSIAATTSITNNGTIAGGGGGGGGGAARYEESYWAGGGGGGGRSSNAANSAAGAGGSVPQYSYPGSSGTAGTVSAAGNGGAGSVSPNNTKVGGDGGNGGGWGTSGSTGGSGSLVVGSIIAGPFSGGTGGGCVTGNSYVTWVATGTRLGSIT